MNKKMVGTALVNIFEICCSLLLFNISCDVSHLMELLRKFYKFCIFNILNQINTRA